MCVDRRFRSPTLLRVGMLCLVISNVLPWLPHPGTTSGVDRLDGLRGLALGLSLGLFYLFFRARHLGTPE